MTREEAHVWCKQLVSAWENVDFDVIRDLFSDTKCYWEDPFSAPGTTIDEIHSFWSEIVYQDINRLSVCPVAIDGNIMVARWYLDYIDKRTNERYEMDGIYQVEFSSQNKCEKFVQWWVMKE